MSKKVTKFSWGAAAVAVLMAGCASSQPERGASSEEEKRAAAREKEQQAGKVEKEETEVIGHEMPGQIGTSTMSQGQATIPV
ncbi:MAG: hypothetical protein NDJ90_15035, partial [Oligoflexia bacterium]|nr:hypothetical protein [Oligoflexia bacterium]